MSGALPFIAWTWVALVLVTAAGQGLRHWLSPDGGNTVVENLNTRIESWWVITILLALALLLGRTGVMLLFLGASFAALREFLTLTTTDRADHYSLAAAFFLVLPLQYLWVWWPWYGLYSIFVPVYAFLLLPMISALRGNPSNFLVRVAETQWALMLCVFCASHIPALLNLDIPGYAGREVLLIGFLIVVVQGSDVLQYLWGLLYGRTVIAPGLSSKTWEACLGGCLSAALIGLLLWWMTPFSPLAAMVMAVLAAACGFFGGLVMNAIKRDRGVRDWGTLMNAQGGIIDRLEGVLFAAPIFFHLTRYNWSV